MSCCLMNSEELVRTQSQLLGIDRATDVTVNKVSQIGKTASSNTSAAPQDEW